MEDTVKLTVIKKDGSRIPYDRQRIVSGVQKACYKRPISMEQMEQLAEAVEEEIYRKQGQEVSSRFIGEQVMERLRRLDKVAYVRFASVYHEFADLGQFISEVQQVMHQPIDSPDQQKLFEE